MFCISVKTGASDNIIIARIGHLKICAHFRNLSKRHIIHVVMVEGMAWINTAKTAFDRKIALALAALNYSRASESSHLLSNLVAMYRKQDQCRC